MTTDYQPNIFTEELNLPQQNESKLRDTTKENK